MLVRFGDISVDSSAREARRGDDIIDIEPRAFELLLYLLEHRDRAVGKDELQDEVWGTIVSDSAMTRSVMKLRKALGDTSESIIKTVPRFGYRFVAEVDGSDEVTAGAPKRSRSVAIGAVAVVALVALAWLMLQLRTDEVIDKSVAVLPFDDLSQAQDQQWFADGLAEEILNSLARTPDLLVSSRTSSFAYRGSQLGIAAIADELGVAHVLEGSVRRDADKLRVTAQLIRADDGFHVWSQNFDHPYTDVIDIQEAVATEIANALQTTMDPERLAEFVSSGTESVAAFEEYLKGISDYDEMIASGDVQAYTGSIRWYERAVEIDPEFGSAWYEIAQFWDGQMSITGILGGLVDTPREEMVRRYEEALDNAIRFTKDATTVLNYRASRAHMDMHLRKALRLNLEYMQLRPNDHWARDRHKLLLGKLNRSEELVEYMQRVYELDTRELVSVARSLLSVAFSGDREAAEALALAAEGLIGYNAIGLYQLHRAFLWSGNIAKGREAFERLTASEMPESNLHLARLRQLCAEGKVDEATKLYAEGQQTFADNLMVVWVAHTVMGEHQAAEDMWRIFDDQDVTQFNGVLQYPTFDPAQYPNLLAHLDEHGDEPGPVLKIPFRCND